MLGNAVYPNAAAIQKRHLPLLLLIHVNKGCAAKNCIMACACCFDTVLVLSVISESWYSRSVGMISYLSLDLR